VSGDVQALRDALIAAKSDAQWSSEMLKEAEKELEKKDELLKSCQADVARLESDLEGAMRVQVSAQSSTPRYRYLEQHA